MIMRANSRGRYLAAVSVVTLVCLTADARAQSVGSLPATQEPASRAGAFPDGARIAFVSLERVASGTAAGKAFTAKIEALRTKKTAEVTERGKQVEALQSKLSQGESVLSDTAREQLRREFERASVDFQRFTQDAQEEMQRLQQELQNAFAAKLFPVVGQLATEKDLWAVFSQDESGILWKNPALDLSDEVATRMDAQVPQQNR
jgi:outer membrane protein